MASNDEKAMQFMQATGTDYEVATAVLEQQQWDLERAITSFLDDGSCPSTGPPASSGPPAPATGHASGGGGGGDVDAEGIRAPIPATRQTLVDDGPSAMGTMPGYAASSIGFGAMGGMSVVDGADFAADITRQRRAPRLRPRRRGPGGAAAAGPQSGSPFDAFEPPREILFEGSFEAARAHAKQTRRHLVANIQDRNEFACHVLNRDVWRDSTVQAIVDSGFVLWQASLGDPHGQQFMTRYDLHNRAVPPIVAFIHGLTGEMVQRLRAPLDPSDMCTALTEFSEKHPMPPAPGVASAPIDLAAAARGPSAAPAAAAAAPPVSSRPPPPADEDEDAMLQAALRASVESSQAAAPAPAPVQRGGVSPMVEEEEDNEEGGSGAEVEEVEEEDDEDAALRRAIAASMADAAGAAQSVPAPAPAPAPAPRWEALDEPEEGDGTAVHVQVRLLSGKRVSRRFPRWATVGHLFAFAEQACEGADGAASPEIDLFAGFPPKSLSGAKESTLADAGLDRQMITVRPTSG